MSVDKKDLIVVRDSRPSDHNFILATWLRGLRYGNDWFELIESGAYYHNYHKFIENLLSKPSVTVLVSCLREDTDVILGYSVCEAEKAHFVFVKKSWRGIGIATSLVPSEVTTVTHVTTIARSIMQKRGNLVFNPFV